MHNNLTESIAEVQNILMNLLGSSNVYYRPPESLKLNYPCFIFNDNGLMASKANNKNYIKNYRFTITYIDRDADTDMVEKILELNHCTLDRPYTINNLNHWVFTYYN